MPKPKNFILKYLITSSSTKLFNLSPPNFLVSTKSTKNFKSFIPTLLSYPLSYPKTQSSSYPLSFFKNYI